MVCEFDPHFRLCADSPEPVGILSLPLPAPPLLMHTHILSLSLSLKITQMCVMFQDSATFEEVAVDFPEEEWAPLDPDQKILRRDMMLGNYRSLASVKYQLSKPKLIAWLEQQELRAVEQGILQGEESQAGSTLSA
uniref:KRAB domain-containing protein n=1 Tax=Panthera leo TaxID=9689 RepID=A0A8C8WIF3_PANLE